MVNMRSNIIVVRKIKEKLHIVLRWRQLENGRLRRYVDSIERLEILASHECMQCSCNTHNTDLFQIMTNEVGASWQTDQENSNEEIAEKHFWELLRGILVEIDASMRTNTWIWP